MCLICDALDAIEEANDVAGDKESNDNKTAYAITFLTGVEFVIRDSLNTNSQMAFKQRLLNTCGLTAPLIQEIGWQEFVTRKNQRPGNGTKGLH